MYLLSCLWFWFSRSLHHHLVMETNTGQLPQDIPDAVLQTTTTLPSPIAEPSHMRFAIHLFALSKINSEIKYVANSINRDAPEYALPAVADISTWQKGVLQRLDSWANDVPETCPHQVYARTLCQIQYHRVRMLLLSPSPAIPKPAADILTRVSHAISLP